MKRAVVIVGAGRMGAAIAAVIRRRGGLSGGRRLGRVGGRDFLVRPRRPRGAQRVTWVLALRDGDLPRAADGLGALVARGDVALHLAGMLGPDAIGSLRPRGCAVGSLHPLVAVALGNAGDVCEGGAFAFEGDRAARAEARALVRALGGTMLEAAAIDRPRYHGGAALVATGAVAIAQGATALFASAITPAPDEAGLRAAVASLLRSVASNVEAVGARRALASPLLRDDTDTVARHLAGMPAAIAALYRAALAVVLEVLEGEGAVKPETLAAARRLLATDAPASVAKVRASLDPTASDRVKSGADG